MIRIKEAIIVEGRYDKNKLAQIFDTLVLETAGFGVFNDREKRILFKRICEEKGIVILTDSDGAGFVIRNHLKGILPKEKVMHAYIPQISGKEKRKAQASKEGFLGVEGIDDSVIIDAVKRAGATFLDGESTAIEMKQISKVDFYEDGLSGGGNSAALRQAVLKCCNLPTHMTANAMLDAFNILYGYDEYKKIVKKAKSACNLW